MLDPDTFAILKEIAALVIPSAVTWGALRADVKHLMETTSKTSDKVDNHIDAHARGEFLK